MPAFHRSDLERIIKRGEKYQYASLNVYTVECPTCRAPAASESGIRKAIRNLDDRFNCRRADGTTRDWHTFHPERMRVAERERERIVEAGREAEAEIERRDQMFRDMQNDTRGKCKWFTLDDARDRQTLFPEAEQVTLF